MSEKGYLLLAALIMAPQQMHSIEKKDYFGFMATTAACAGLGYSCYKVYEFVALHNAKQRLARYKEYSDAIIAADRNTQEISDVLLIKEYVNRPQEYETLCELAAHDVESLRAIQVSIEEDISWAADKTARQAFANCARPFMLLNNQRLIAMNERKEFLDNRRSLIALANLISTEFNASYAQFISLVEKNKGMLNESVVRSGYPQELFPLRQAWKDIQSRRQQFESHCARLQRYSIQSECSEYYAQQARYIISVLSHAQNAIAGFEAYTHELRLERQHELEIERTMQAQRAAQAAEESAYAQLRQAQAYEEANRSSKEQELASLRSELAELKSQHNAGYTDYYLKQNLRDLQKRIHKLKVELGQVDLFSTIIDFATDHD